jgi:hypothetical protein
MPGDPRIRASDADRDRVAALLREHHLAGRLTPSEFTERLDGAMAARTLGELDDLLEDLPAIDLYRLPSADIPPRRGGIVRRPPSGDLYLAQQAGWVAWGGVNVLLVLFWGTLAVMDGGLAWIPWFLLIAIPWGLRLGRGRQD